VFTVCSTLQVQQIGFLTLGPLCCV